MGIQNTVWAVDPAVACETCTAPLGCSPRAPGKLDLRQSPVDRREESLCGSSGFQWGTTSILLKEKNKRKQNIQIGTNWGESEVGGIVWFYPYYAFPFPKAAPHRAKRGLIPQFLLWGKVRVCECAPSFPSCEKCCRRSLFLSCLIQNTELCAASLVWRLWEEAGGPTRYDSQRALGMQILLTAGRFHQNAHLWAAEGTLPMDAPTGPWAPSVLLTPLTHIYTQIHTNTHTHPVTGSCCVSESFGR